jgi:tetratricopeptide (TPR) repeat protein
MGETLYGRDREVMELLDLLIAERIVLLYSPSGAGKTSLIQAALIPKLKKEGFQVLPVMRVSLEPPPDVDRPPTANRYILSLLLSLEEALPEEQQRPVAELAGMELTEYLARRPTVADEPNTKVLIFDQFEEILTVDPTDRAAKEAFFAQVSAALRQRHRWAMFAMREEYLAGLDLYLRPIPTRLSTTFRLELLGEEAARLAIQRPAHLADVGFTDAAAHKLVDNLRRVRVQQLDGDTVEQLGLYVEPVQLQVVCRRLWEQLPANATQIGEADVESVGDVDSALADYYAERVEAIAGETSVRQRAIREWFDCQLITEQGIRGQVLQEPERSQALENQAIWPLVDAYLVRAEKRRGATWFELAHDRLIEPVRKNNAEWFQANLSLLQRRADLWERQNRLSDFLLREEELEAAERWAADHGEELTSVERDFLDDCREARAAAKRDRRNNIRIRVFAVTVTIFGFLVAYSLYQTIQERNRAEEQTRLATSRRLAAKALSSLDDRVDVAQLDLALLLSIEAVQIENSFEARNSMLNGLQYSPRLTGFLHGHPNKVNSVAFSPEGKILASGSRDGTLILWDVAERQPLGQPLTAHKREVMSLAFSPDGKILASGSGDNTVILWDVAERQPLGQPLTAHKREVMSLAFSPDGKTLASGNRDGSLILWDVAERQRLGRPLAGHTASVYSVAFSPDGKTLVSGSEDSSIILWNGEFLWDVSLKSSKARACSIVNRNLMLSEWKQFVGEVGKDFPDKLTCCDLPIHPSFIDAAKALAQAGDRDGMDRAVALFQKARDLDPSLKLDPQTEAKKSAAQGLVARGRNRAREGNVEAAVASFQKARNLDPSLKLDPQTEARKGAAEALVAQGRSQARAGDVEAAVASFQKATDLDPSLKLDPQIEANKGAAQGLIVKGQQLVEQGNVKDALAAYAEAQRLYPTLEISDVSWNTLCWEGSLWGHASEVMTACKQAVSLSPEEGYIHDSRGLARAQTGDIDGAIADFQAYIGQLRDEKKRSQRQRWIDALRAGQNPFTPEELERLRNP